MKAEKHITFISGVLFSWRKLWKVKQYIVLGVDAKLPHMTAKLQ